MGISLLVEDAHGDTPMARPRLPMSFAREAGEVGIADREIDINGVGLVDRYEHGGFACADEVSRV